MNEEYYSYTKKFMRKWAPIFGRMEIFISRLRDKVVDFTNAENNAKILDMCTGAGGQAFAFAKRGYEVVGIDLSEEMITVANKKNKFENLEFKIADATNMPFKDDYFNASCVPFALHDMPISIRKKVLEEMVRVTKPKGIIIIVDYALPKNKIGRYLIYHFVKSYETQYYPEFIKSDLQALLRESGIKIEEELSILFGVGRILKGIK